MTCGTWAQVGGASVEKVRGVLGEANLAERRVATAVLAATSTIADVARCACFGKCLRCIRGSLLRCRVSCVAFVCRCVVCVACVFSGGQRRVLLRGTAGLRKRRRGRSSRMCRRWTRHAKLHLSNAPSRGRVSSKPACMPLWPRARRHKLTGCRCVRTAGMPDAHPNRPIGPSVSESYSKLPSNPFRVACQAAFQCLEVTHHPERSHTLR